MKLIVHRIFLNMKSNLLMALAMAWTVLPCTATAAEPVSVGKEAMQSDTQEEGRATKSIRLIKQAVFDIDDDLKEIVLYPFNKPTETLLFLGGVGALVAVDRPVTTYYQDKVEPVFQGYRITTPKFADFLPFNGADSYWVLGIAGSYVLGVGFNDERSQKAAILSTKAIVYSQLVTQLFLKSVIGRMRPDPNLSKATANNAPYTTNPYDFGNTHRPYLGAKSYGTSMPSYHFTSYFAVARVYSKVYDNYLIPYGVTAALLAANIKGHHHWVSDMVAGALIGTMIGSVVVDNAEDGEAPSTMLFPSYSNGEVSLNMYHQF